MATPYTADQLSTGLDALTNLTIATGDLIIVGDVSDSGYAKGITTDNLDTYFSQTSKNLTNKTITSANIITSDINDATADSLQAGTSSSGILLKNNAGTTVASFGVGSSSSTNISLGGTVALGTNSITMTGSIAATGARVTKGWFTDVESTNMYTVGGTSLSSTFAALAGSTGQAFSVSSIDISNSDTTISRSASGVIAVEGVVIPSISSTNTLTNKRITKRTSTTNAPGATPTTNTDNVDIQIFTGLGTAITSMTTNLSGTPSTGDKLEIWFTDDGTARAITWGASFASSGTVTLPTTTVISTTLRVGLVWSGSVWTCVAKA